jgi:hypothetical protein
MMIIYIKRHLKRELTGNVIILIASIVLVYLFISLYFINHCFFNTVINGVDVSLKAHGDVEDMIRGHIKDYKLQLLERHAEIEEIIGQDIGLQYSKEKNTSQIFQMQYSLKWPSSLFRKQKYYVHDLFVYSKKNLENIINGLNCLNRGIIEPQNASFKYTNGSYEVIEEVYGNKIHKDKLDEVIKMSIAEGETKVDLNESLCYESPKYTLRSDRTLETRNLLNKYVSTKITYLWRGENEIVDPNLINQWLRVDENLEVIIDKRAVKQYVQGLSKKYDTVGVARKFKTSVNKIVEVRGGFYGWKIDCAVEIIALLDNIKLGQVLDKEPIYAQKALSGDKNDIGNTYVEINITRQHLWFYKDGKLIAQGAIVTGNPNKGNATTVGVYMLNYKQKGSTLRGHNYEAEVTYWMPFNGNIGIHDASWRHSFGGNIYKRNGTHGCVNVPLYLAKTIFEKIKDGTPVICYEE